VPSARVFVCVCVCVRAFVCVRVWCAESKKANHCCSVQTHARTRGRVAHSTHTNTSANVNTDVEAHCCTARVSPHCCGNYARRVSIASMLATSSNDARERGEAMLQCVPCSCAMRTHHLHRSPVCGRIPLSSLPIADSSQALLWRSCRGRSNCFVSSTENFRCVCAPIAWQCVLSLACILHFDQRMIVTARRCLTALSQIAHACDNRRDVGVGLPIARPAMQRPPSAACAAATIHHSCSPTPPTDIDIDLAQSRAGAQPRA
jgi:hypothetical protein